MGLGNLHFEQVPGVILLISPLLDFCSSILLDFLQWSPLPGRPPDAPPSHYADDSSRRHRALPVAQRCPKDWVCGDASESGAGGVLLPSPPSLKKLLGVFLSQQEALGKHREVARVARNHTDSRSQS